MITLNVQVLLFVTLAFGTENINDKTSGVDKGGPKGPRPPNGRAKKN